MSRPVGRDSIVELKVRNMRSLADVSLRFEGFKVLIGENGAGKSSLVEACRLISKLGSSSFGSLIAQSHGGMSSLLRRGASSIAISFRIEGNGPPLRYTFELEERDLTFVVASEALVDAAAADKPGNGLIMTRNQKEARIFQAGRDDIVWAAHTEPQRLALTGPWGVATPAFERVLRACSSVEIHLPFNTLPRWASKDAGRDQAMRSANVIQPATSVELLGTNLANAFFALQSNRLRWHETLEIIRLGLGDDVEDISLTASPEGGSIALSVLYRSIGRVPAFALSDGTLAFLALVAIYRIESPQRSLLVFDEPDVHLHPRLIRRVASFFEVLAESHPVLLTTHSDALLDSLSEPASAAILCELDEARATRLRIVDRAALDSWLDDYRGLGDVRGSGHEQSVFAAEES